jgi:hypothetical protein
MKPKFMGYDMKHLDLSFKTVVSVSLEGNFAGHAAIFDIEDKERNIIVPGAIRPSLISARSPHHTERP